MGLDMYASTLMQAPKSDVDFDGNDAIELRYWRKHPNLHGWMESLYYEKGGTADRLNCVNLQLYRQGSVGWKRQSAAEHCR